MTLSAIASATDMPLSATHRLLAELVRVGYVRQLREQGDYVLTIKLASLGLAFLSASGMVDVAQPSLDALAETSRELVRLAIVDGDELVFVAKAQGATRGLRYDPDMGLSVRLSCSAAGHALAVDDERRAGAGSAWRARASATPRTSGRARRPAIKALLAYVRSARKRGYAMIIEVFAPGMSSMAAPVRLPSGPTIGVVTIAGPMVRLTEERMLGARAVADGHRTGGDGRKQVIDPVCARRGARREHKGGAERYGRANSGMRNRLR